MINLTQGEVVTLSTDVQHFLKFNYEILHSKIALLFIFFGPSLLLFQKQK